MPKTESITMILYYHHMEYRLVLFVFIDDILIEPSAYDMNVNKIVCYEI